MATYGYSGTIVQVTVETGGTYDISAYGGGGGASSNYAGGKGAEAGGLFNLTQGEKLDFVVGGAGKYNTGDGGGGGASQVFANVGPNGAFVPLLVAGGGGGGIAGNGLGKGGYGGANASGTGGSGAGGAAVYGGGGAGAYSDGGVSGQNGAGGGSDLANGAAGGAAAYGTVAANGGFGGGGGAGPGGGGGGGGFTGGAGGAAGNGSGGSGGSGGTSYVAASGTPDMAQTKNGADAPQIGNGSVTFSPDVTCYATGTAIRVIRDGDLLDVAVENLVIGDVAVTASGAHRAIAWIGSRALDCTTWDDPRQVRPIRIAKDAFGEGRPTRDLFVSPDHALTATTAEGEEILVPAFAFLNGATVTQPHAGAVTYWHVELEGGHDILLAESLPAESYLDCGNRGFFAGADMAMDPALDAANSCRRRANDEATLRPLRAALREQAIALGWRLEAPLLAEIGLMVDGLIVHPEVNGLSARVFVPAGTRQVRLVAPASVPWEVSDQADARALGLYLAAITIDDGLGFRSTVALDDPRLTDMAEERLGFHATEGEGDIARRWTTASATIPASLWAGCERGFFLRLDLAAPPLPRWRAPRKAGAPHLTLMPAF